MIVRDIMSSPVVTVTADASIQAVAQLMRDRHISGVPVVDNGGRLIGIVTEVDLIAQHAPARAPSYISLLWATIPLRLDDYTRYKDQVRHILAVNAEQLMTEDPATVSPEATLEQVAELMIQPGHSSLPVLENDQLVGIITRTDLVRVIEALEVQE